MVRGRLMARRENQVDEGCPLYFGPHSYCAYMADFGLARSTVQRVSSGTFAWREPQVAVGVPWLSRRLNISTLTAREAIVPIAHVVYVSVLCQPGCPGPA